LGQLASEKAKRLNLGVLDIRLNFNLEMFVIILYQVFKVFSNFQNIEDYIQTSEMLLCLLTL